MYTAADLDREITQIVFKKMAAKESFNADAVAIEICRNHITTFENQHSDWFAFTGYKTARACAGKVITHQGKKIRKHNGKQFTFGGVGFDHIQDYYIVKRDDADTAVPSVLPNGRSGLSYDEWTALINHLDAESATKKSHSNEARALRDMLFAKVRTQISPVKSNEI